MVDERGNEVIGWINLTVKPLNHCREAIQVTSLSASQIIHYSEFLMGCLWRQRPWPCHWCGYTVAAYTITLPLYFQWGECLFSLADTANVDILHKQITSSVHLLITSLFSPFCCKSHSLAGLHWFNLYQIANAVIRHAWPPLYACFPHYAYAFTSNYSK